MATPSVNDAIGSHMTFVGTLSSVSVVMCLLAAGAHYDLGRQDFVLSNELVTHEAFK
jgi:hypothetical protein